MRQRRYKKERSARTVFLVICEGETECCYVEMLTRLYRIPITIKTRISGNRINGRLVSQYVRDLGLFDGDEYRVYYMYDADVGVVADKIRALPGKAILTNPCLELWYLLHSRACARAVSSDEVVKSLADSHSCWSHYSKGRLSDEQIRFLCQMRGNAVVNAAKLMWPGNPLTNMHDFIADLESQKR